MEGDDPPGTKQVEDVETALAADMVRTEEPAEKPYKPKIIILFSDGTGNSSAKLFKTNVWRMYEALDLGPPADPNDLLQIAYYDNGVGTSNFRPLAALGGIFGFGLKRNILRLYSFLCRNYQPGDKIYAFGFSRGAFTIRLLVGLIAGQGVLVYRGEGELSYQVRDAYRAFATALWPNRWLSRKIATVTRRIRAGLLFAKRKMLGQTLYRDVQRHQPNIDFVGVWDTVAAYGGPIAEITRGIDDWIWPLTMPNYGLSSKVLQARHALALDDERDAFQPLLWDEVREAQKIEAKEVSPDRLKQVWFAGMHSDVGGGYPDESLSYVSLLWMMDELKPQLRLLDPFVERARGLANICGPIHNSREGLGAYYRYQPRKIKAMLDPVDHTTLMLRDPEVSRGIGPHGLLTKVRIHESVIARIVAGTDRYAPLALPQDFEVIEATGPHARASLGQDDLDAFSAISAQRRAQRFALQEDAWNLVWSRRIVYFATVAASVALLALPFYPALLSGIEKYCSDDRCFASTPIGWVSYFVPEFAKLWVGSFVDKPVVTLLLVGVILLLLGIGRRMESTLRDRMRGVWSAFVRGRPWPKGNGSRGFRAFRESRLYQYAIYFVKWRLLPTIAGWSLILIVAFALLAVVTQTFFAFAEPRDIFCKSPEQPATGINPAAVPIRTMDSCTDLGSRVVKGGVYRLTLKVTEDWKDGGYTATPDRGVTKPMPWYVERTGPALRRVVKAQWMQPLIEIRSPARSTARGFLLGPPIYVAIAQFKPVAGQPGLYVAEFKSLRTGELYFFVNDAALPIGTTAFYSNNRGAALVRLEQIGP
jgi:uncharacterized protein (DUF2235 family)